MDAVVKEEKNMIEPKKEAEESVELLEPKIELIDEMDVETDEEENDEYQYIVPYEYRDYVEQHIEKEQPTNSRKGTNKKKECRKCGKLMLQCSPAYLERHVATHTNITRYSCYVEGCIYKSCLLRNVMLHIKRKHKMSNPTVENVVCREFSDEEKIEITKVRNECFPAGRKTVLSEDFTFDCRICKKSVKEARPTWKNSRRIHVHFHTDFMFYKCIESNCDFEARRRSSIISHIKTQHGIVLEPMPVQKIELTNEQNEEIERMLIQCFPELKDESDCRIDVDSDQDTANMMCQKCGAMIDRCLEDAKKHAAIHTNSRRFKCEECDFKSLEYGIVKRHAKKLHNIDSCSVLRVNLTEDELGLKSMVKKCFPGFAVVEEGRKRNRDEEVVEPRKKKKIAIECNICWRNVVCYSTLDIEKHAALHIDLRMYKCSAEGCDFTHSSEKVLSHIKTVHSTISCSGLKRQLTDDESQELKLIIDECFPGLNNSSWSSIVKPEIVPNIESKCQKCSHKIIGDDSTAEKLKREHSMTHFKAKLFKCDDCTFAVNQFSFLAHHARSKHGKEFSAEERKIQLEKQEVEMSKLAEKCFPKNDAVQEQVVH